MPRLHGMTKTASATPDPNWMGTVHNGWFQSQRRKILPRDGRVLQSSHVERDQRTHLARRRGKVVDLPSPFLKAVNQPKLGALRPISMGQRRLCVSPKKKPRRFGPGHQTHLLICPRLLLLRFDHDRDDRDQIGLARVMHPDILIPAGRLLSEIAPNCPRRDIGRRCCSIPNSCCSMSRVRDSLRC